MHLFPFPHDLSFHIIADDVFEVAYYSLDKKKYKRVRRLGSQNWQDTIPIEISDDTFWMIMACIEGRKKARDGLA